MKKYRSLWIVAGLILFLCGCSTSQEVENGRPYEIYYLNKEETKVISMTYETAEVDRDLLIAELMEQLTVPTTDMQGRPPIAGSVQLLSYEVEEDQLVLKFDERYKELSHTTEVLTRAAIVRTLAQVPGINYVSMKLKEENLTDANGNPVGIMTADMFIDNAGKEINAYERAKIRLYFADETGTRLIETSRKLVYSTNISMEKLLVEELIKGPKNESIYPLINPATKVNSVTVKDGICYVNLSDAFLTQVYNVSAEVTIYAITNALVELPNVNKVQISVNGETDILFRESIKLTTVFERNLELVGRNNTE